MNRFTVVLACLCGVSVAGQTAPAAPAIVSATVIAEALPVGFRISAIAVEYSERLGSARIPVSAFAVEALGTKESTVQAGPRTVTKAYINDTAATSNRARPGKYVILELAPTDKNSIGRSNAAILTLKESHSVRRAAPITMNRRTIAASAAPIKDVLLGDRGGPVYLQAWGGQSTIDRALKSIKLQYEKSPRWSEIQEKVSKKAIIQAFGDQGAVTVAA
jgi:hypothetical protein